MAWHLRGKGLTGRYWEEEPGLWSQPELVLSPDSGPLWPSVSSSVAAGLTFSGLCRSRHGVNFWEWVKYAKAWEGPWGGQSRPPPPARTLRCWTMI